MAGNFKLNNAWYPEIESVLDEIGTIALGLVTRGLTYTVPEKHEDPRCMYSALVYCLKMGVDNISVIEGKSRVRTVHTMMITKQRDRDSWEAFLFKIPKKQHQEWEIFLGWKQKYHFP